MSDKHPCCDLTPKDDCNKTCCPDYEPDSDWCKSFNVRTQEQLKETTQVSIDGMWFNIEDAKNTIGQAEQYLAMIYELLLASLDQVMKASSSAARTDGDFESASVKVREFVNEIHLIVGGSQYNGRNLLQDTTTAKRGTNNTDFKSSETSYTNIFPQEDAGYDSNDITNTSTQVDSSGTAVANDLVINDSRVYGDVHERESIHYRLAGPRGSCRNVGAVFNDFVYELPPVGVHSLGLTSFTSKGGQDYHIQGINEWTSDDGIIGPDGPNDDDVDETVSDFNCAIKTVGVELDKLRSYRYILCLREKQVRIYKEGQQVCYEHKQKI
jgi:flagellin-like hook-associated protein FlgL